MTKHANFHSSRVNRCFAFEKAIVPHRLKKMFSKIFLIEFFSETYFFNSHIENTVLLNQKKYFVGIYAKNSFVLPTKHFSILIKFWLLKQNVLLGQQNFFQHNKNSFVAYIFFSV